MRFRNRIASTSGSPPRREAAVPRRAETPEQARYRSARELAQKIPVPRTTRALCLPSVRGVDWPPKPGDFLPRAGEPVGVRDKLLLYALKEQHEVGGPKATGFAVILGITAESVDHLEAEICIAILNAPVASVRDNPPYGTNCVVEIAVRGVGHLSERVVNVRTVWEHDEPGSRPRLVSVFPKN